MANLAYNSGERQALGRRRNAKDPTRQNTWREARQLLSID